MRLVVDSNIVFAALLRDGVARALLIEPPFDLLSPEWMLVEIRKHREDIANRAGLMLEEIDALLTLVTERIKIVPRTDYDARLEEARRRIHQSDPGDVPFLALTLARECDGIWTQNTRDYANGGVPIWTTANVVEWVRERAR